MSRPMQIRIGPMVAALTLSGAILAACSEGPSVSRASHFRDDYNTARAALENENFAKAAKQYKALIPVAGPLAPRMELEYAHALLRDEQFEAAAGVARQLAATQSDTARAAALAVQGTAEHETALSLMDADPRDPRAVSYLRSASQALGVAIADPAELDPLGALATRKRSIDALLAGFS
ncbi:hypothetical protein [Pseudoruegeria sp. SHC-113]|uniref:hypothetical protein n=1 Tax=Pseudoruegeria sp. SHC-113 TaxID=2855439 RepID=UPI0021BB0A74|nr:hypothetical protein [Pseudoruegeria sp. SHC-113]MCT8161668.1 hypothetical protein [Pseudoruegeria sp. SHC-113]